MSPSIVSTQARLLEGARSKRLDRFGRKVLLSLMGRLARGKITLIDGYDRKTFGSVEADGALEATVDVHHPRFYRYAVFGGTIGAAEAYMAGHWSSDDLTTVIRILLLNRHIFQRMDKGWGRISAPLHQWFHWLNKNTKEGSRINIASHYDLGNDFYALFLDDTLTYSCGIFEQTESSLKEASIAKYERICKKLQLNGSDHVLEIGTGWGGFAIYAALNFGCSVTTTTISPAQHELAKKRIEENGLSDRITLLRKDYRDLRGTFDKVVSIEMIEAVGHHYFDTFFRCCSDRLKEDGLMLLQAITIADQVFEAHKRSVDFIKRFIFPGSCIPSFSAMSRSVAKATDLRMVHVEDLTWHYARTLREWRHNFFENMDRVRNLGYSDFFTRMWEYYLCYCEAGFSERYLGDLQILLAKPFSRIESPLPTL
jgi:cyclopropane-fatty-acyl-phospholipid synthase